MAATESHTNEQVRIEASVALPAQVLITEDVYERWQEGDAVAREEVLDALLDSARALMEDAVVGDVKLHRAVLVEPDGYLGTDVSTLKFFS